VETSSSVSEGRFRVRVLALAYIIALGAGLGLASAHIAVAGRPLIGKVRIGAWDTWTRGGSRDVDPYMRGYLARGVHLPLGAGEGLDLIAAQDDPGQPLDARCRYLITGATPTARGWTLQATDLQNEPLRTPLDRSGFSDAEIVRDESGSLRIVAASDAQPGNWLPLPGSGRFRLRLRLYDTPVSSQAGELRPDVLPRVTRLDCQ
jgi:hypothetical protein